DLDHGARRISVDLQEHVADAQGRTLGMSNDDLDLVHVGHRRGMIAELATGLSHDQAMGRLDMRTTVGGVARAANRTDTAKPSMSGRWTSSSTTPGRRRAAAATAPSPKRWRSSMAGMPDIRWWHGLPRSSVVDMKIIAVLGTGHMGAPIAR